MFNLLTFLKNLPFVGGLITRIVAAIVNAKAALMYWAWPFKRDHHIKNVDFNEVIANIQFEALVFENNKRTNLQNLLKLRETHDFVLSEDVLTTIYEESHWFHLPSDARYLVYELYCRYMEEHMAEMIEKEADDRLSHFLASKALLITTIMLTIGIAAKFFLRSRQVTAIIIRALALKNIKVSAKKLRSLEAEILARISCFINSPTLFTFTSNLLGLIHLPDAIDLAEFKTYMIFVMDFCYLKMHAYKALSSHKLEFSLCTRPETWAIQYDRLHQAGGIIYTAVSFTNISDSEKQFVYDQLELKTKIPKSGLKLIAVAILDAMEEEGLNHLEYLEEHLEQHR